MPSVSSIDAVEIEISVILGQARMPIRHLLKMGRGAVIELDAHLHDDVWIYANNRLFGRGEIVVKGENIAIEVSRVLMKDQS